MLDNISTFSHGFFWGFISFPVVYYLVKAVGKQVWDDVSVLADNFWRKEVAAVKAAI